VASTAATIDQFPLLRAARNRIKATEAQGRMLALAGLEETLLERFTAALKQYSMSENMTGAADQSRLVDIFATKYEERERQRVHLRSEHFTAVRAQWKDDSENAFAFRLLCMATLYTNYSSSRFFGTETDSPNALRAYAEALLRQVGELAPGLLPNNQLEEWVGKLRGTGNLFQCTAVLYGLQSTHLADILKQEEGDDRPLRQVRDEMIPLEWREAHAA
jgi:hypothetical protein